MSRIQATFDRCKNQGKTALVTFTMAGDPSPEISLDILLSLPGLGVDIVELGIPFSDPAADGPSIQAAGVRALQARTTMETVLDIARQFRAVHLETPLVLMGYYNPIFRYGDNRFAEDAAAAGVDGVIIVDLPPEEEAGTKAALENAGIALVRLIAPTTEGERLEKLLKSASGFVYTIAVKGITGTRSATAVDIDERVKSIRKHTSLPVVVGFGIKTSKQASALKGVSDGLVIGSALVDTLHAKNGSTQAAAEFLKPIAAALQH